MPLRPDPSAKARMTIPLNQHGWASPASRNDHRIFSTAASHVLIDGLLSLL